MAYASRAGRAVANPQNPRAFAVCDRCGLWHNHYKLQFQHEWRGTKLQNLNLLVSHECLDVPNPQLKSRILPPDPTPIRNPRPEWFMAAEIDNLSTQLLEPILTQGGDNIIVDNIWPQQPIQPIPSPSPLTWALLQVMYPGLLSLNGGVVMASSFPITPGVTFNGGNLVVSDPLPADAPAWAYLVPSTTDTLVSGQVFLNGGVVMVI